MARIEDRNEGKDDDSAGGREETEAERLDRNLAELLEGLRVALPGVQVLFAFLLILPFQMTFADITDFQKHVYYVTLCATALASACLIGPSARHRIRFRDQDKKWVVLSANRLAISGLVALSVAITGVILLVSDYIWGKTTTIIATAVIAALIGWLWFGSPLARELGDTADD